MQTTGGSSWEEWIWTIRNGIGAVAALLLGYVLSEVSVFQEAALGSTGFSAADAVRLLGYGIALVLIWMTAWRAADQIRAVDPLSRLLSEGLPPLATLVVTPGVYNLARPFLTDPVVLLVSWIFVLLMLVTGVWLGSALYNNADALMAAAAAIRRRALQSVEVRGRACPKCGTANSATARFCADCGASLPSQTGGDERATVGRPAAASSELRRSA